MKNKIISLLLLSILLTNCVSKRMLPLTKEDIVFLKGKTIAIVHEEEPYLAVMTYKNVMIAALTGGILGYVFMKRDGNKIIKENQIKDPANLISSNLSKDFKLKYGATIIDEELSKDVGSVSSLSSKYNGKADYVLDVRTINWGFGYLPMRVNDFRVVYSSKLRFIDVKNKKIIAEDFCSIIPDSKEPTSGYQDLLYNNAEILKQKLTTHSVKCFDKFKNEIFHF